LLLGCFSDRVLPQTVILLHKASCVAGITDVSHSVWLIGGDGILLTFLPGLVSNCDPPNLCLPRGKEIFDYQLVLLLGLLRFLCANPLVVVLVKAVECTSEMGAKEVRTRAANSRWT
jgi:hypothetical protein